MEIKMLLTNRGEELASLGFITGEFPKLTSVKFGDGNGTIVSVTSDMTELVNVIYTGISTTATLSQDPNGITIHSQIPAKDGGFTIREIGVYDNNDELIAVCGGFEEYKNSYSEIPENMNFYLQLNLSSNQMFSVEFTNDNTYATQESVDLLAKSILEIPRSPMTHASSVILDGEYQISEDDRVDVVAMNTVMYSGNGTTKAVDLGVGLIDFTKPNNGTGYYHDRSGGAGTIGVVKRDDGTISESGEIQLPLNMFIAKTVIKSIDGVGSWIVADGLRGGGNAILYDTQEPEQSFDGLITYTNVGVTVGNNININKLNINHLVDFEVYDRLKWGMTEDDLFYIMAYNDEAKIGMMVREHLETGVVVPRPFKCIYNFRKRLEGVLDRNWSGEIFHGDVTKGLALSTTASISIGHGYNPSVVEVTDTSVTNGITTSEVLPPKNAVVDYFYGDSDYRTIVTYDGNGSSSRVITVPSVSGTKQNVGSTWLKLISGVSSSGWSLHNPDIMSKGTHMILNNSGTVIVTSSSLSYDFSVPGQITATTPSGDTSGNTPGMGYALFVQFTRDDGPPTFKYKPQGKTKSVPGIKTVLYTGTGTTVDVDLGVNIVDFTKPNNGTGYYHDRSGGVNTIGTIKKDNGTVVESGSIELPVGVYLGRFRLTSRDDENYNPYVMDSIRGINRTIRPSTYGSEREGVQDDVGIFSLEGTFFSVGGTIYNTISSRYFLKYEIYTHIDWNMSSSGVVHIRAWNPETKLGMNLRKGVSTSYSITLPFDVDYLETKCLGDYGEALPGEGRVNGMAWRGSNEYILRIYAMSVDSPELGGSYDNTFTGKSYLLINPSNTVTYGNLSNSNMTGYVFVDYYFGNSDFKQITQYTGDGAGTVIDTTTVSGLKQKISSIEMKCLTANSNWLNLDVKRGLDKIAFLNRHGTETGNASIQGVPDLTNGLGSITYNNTGHNASGHTYLAIVEYDNNGSGDTMFNQPVPVNNSLIINKAIMTYTDGFADNGYNVKYTSIVNESIGTDADITGTYYAYRNMESGEWSLTNVGPVIGLGKLDNQLTFEKGHWYTNNTNVTDIIKNGTFETNIDHWESLANSTVAWISSKRLQITNTRPGVDASFPSAIQKIYGLTVGRSYTVRLNYEANTTDGSQTALVRTRLSSGAIDMSNTGNVTWHGAKSGTMSLTFTPTESEVWLEVVGGDRITTLQVWGVTSLQDDGSELVKLDDPISFFPYTINLENGVITGINSNRIGLDVIRETINYSYYEDRGLWHSERYYEYVDSNGLTHKIGRSFLDNNGSVSRVADIIFETPYITECIECQVTCGITAYNLDDHSSYRTETVTWNAGVPTTTGCELHVKNSNAANGLVIQYHAIGY